MNFFVKVTLIFFLRDFTGAHCSTFSWTREIHVDYREFGNVKPPPYDTLVGENNHSLALLRCRSFDDGYPRNCNLTRRTHTFDGREYSSVCEIQPPAEDDVGAALPDGVTFLTHDRVLVAWREEHRVRGWRMSFQVISIDYCQNSHFIHVYPKMDEETAVYEVLKFKNSFDIIFEDDSCPQDKYRKVTYDHDGQPLNSVPSSISSSLLSRNDKFAFEKAYPVIYNAGEGTVLIGRKDESPYRSKNIYSPLMGWLDAKNLSHSENVYSNSSGFATLCWRPSRVPNQLSCKWLDGSRANETLTFEFKPFFEKMPLIYNSPDGNVVIVNRGLDERGMLILYVDEVTVYYYSSEVLCKRYAKVFFPAYADLVAISMTTPRDQFCYSYLFKDWHSFGNPSVIRYTLNTTCVGILRDRLYYESCGR